MMGKSDGDKLGFSFAKLTSIDNYKKWAQKIQYFLKFAGLWDYIFSKKENPRPVTIIFKGNNLNNNVKLIYQKKYLDKITI